MTGCVPGVQHRERLGRMSCQDVIDWTGLGCNEASQLAHEVELLVVCVFIMSRLTLI